MPNDEILELRRLTVAVTTSTIDQRLITATDTCGYMKEVYDRLSSLGAPENRVPITREDAQKLGEEVLGESKKPVADAGELAARWDDTKERLSPMKSIKKDSITCLICNKSMRVLTKHLREAHNMPNAEYRPRFGLPKDQPLAAKDLSDQKRLQSKHLLKPRASRKPTLNLGLE
jgi:predicted transcriptional regulator